MDYFDRLADDARAALKQAELLAHLTRSPKLETSHLLLAIIGQDETPAATLLREMNVDPEPIRLAIKLKPGIVVSNGPISIEPSGTVKVTVNMAVRLAEEAGESSCDTTYLLFCMICQRGAKAGVLLEQQGVDIDELMNHITRFLQDDKPSYVEAGEAQSGHKDGRAGGSFLSRYTTDLTRLAQAGQLDPVIGRQTEIDRLITIISRKTKNNPVLIGEAGVGKTAVVEGLARQIACGEVPDFLQRKRLLEVDLGAMVAGTKYRGEFEDRLKRLIKEVDTDDNVIIFIDELHLLVGAGSAEGSMDAANLLKPALARGKFRLIGATTSDEYRKFVEKDTALARRLQEIVVKAPGTADTIKILTGLAPRYEEYHHVRISEDVISEVVRLSDRYLSERQQPDKAIDVLDETAARVRIANAGSEQAKELMAYRAEAKKLAKDMERAVAEEDYEHAALYKMRLSQLKDLIGHLEKKQSEGDFVAVKVNDVARSVSQMTGIPLEQLKRSEAVKLANLEKRLGDRVIGQHQAIEAVAQAIRRSRAGIGDPHRPIGSFIFLGSTGVGKTELARVLAQEVFGSDKSLIKVDMSEYTERHTVSRLVGAPAGYVGYDDGGQLTERVRRQPYSVVLFDEIEKAHPDVFNILLQILEDGVLTDGHGKVVDFSNCVVILTSNVGASELGRESVGYAVSGEEATDAHRRLRGEKALKALRQTMRPELINRFDKVVLFNGLGTKEVGQILNIMLERLSRRLQPKGIAFTITPKLRRYLIDHGYDTKYGARPLRRIIQDKLESVLADQLILGKIKRGQVVRADLTNGDEVVIKVQSGVATNRRLRAV